MLGVMGMITGLCLAIAGTFAAAESTGKTTLDNLQAAFNGESNANIKIREEFTA